ncbi:MAG: DUF4214 domain-containing protein [Pseudomonadota bacterium]
MCHLCTADYQPCLHYATTGDAPPGAVPPVTGFAWGDGSGSGGTITWSIAGPGHDVSLFTGNTVSDDPTAFFPYDMADAAREAFGVWSEAADIDFVQVADGGGDNGEGANADIRIFLGRHAPGQIIGQAFLPLPNASGSDILIANDQRFLRDTEDGGIAYLTFVFLHEIGHALGLGHVTREDAVMHRQIPNTKIRETLAPEDLAQLRLLYRLRDEGEARGPLDYRMPEERADLDVIDTPQALRVIGNDLANRISGTEGAETLEGGAGADRLEGRAGADEMLGGAGPDTLLGGAGDDWLEGNGGADRLVGGAGFDTARVGGVYAPQAASFAPDGALLTRGDRLEGVERVHYDNGVLALDTEGALLGEVVRLYRAAFGREGDAGVLFWQDQRLAGSSALAVARAFTDSLEFQTRYGVDPEDEAYVEALYDNVLGRPGEAGGVDFWTAELGAGRSRAEVLLAFAEAPETVVIVDQLLAAGLFFADPVA